MSGDEGFEVRRRPSREAASDGFDAWMVTLPDDLDSYTERFIGESQEAYTVGSLARAEEALLAHRDDRDVFFGTMRYLGETLLREDGGRWEWEELWETSAPGAGLPFVRVDGPDGYLTGGTVNLFQACGIAGATGSGTVLTELVTAVVEAFGPAGPKRRCSELTTFVDEETWPALEELMVAHREQVARFVAEHDRRIGPLDGSPESLDRVEQLFVDTYPDREAVFADWESPRVMGAARYVRRSSSPTRRDGWWSGTPATTADPRTTTSGGRRSSGSSPAARSAAGTPSSPGWAAPSRWLR